MEPTPVGRRLKLTREALGWSQGTLARQAGVPRGWISLVELGDIAQPGEDHLVAVARALHTTTTYLRTGNQEGVSLSVDADDLPDFARFRVLPRWVRHIALTAGETLLQQVPRQHAENHADGDTAAENGGHADDQGHG